MVRCQAVSGFCFYQLVCIFRKVPFTVQSKILVTGASGNVGREVVKSLLALGRDVRAAAIDEEDAKRVPAGCIDTTLFDFGNPNTYAGAFAGVAKMFLMRPPQISDVERYLFPVIDYAKSIGVKQVVFLSLMGVNRLTPHYKVESYLKRSGMAYTFIRPGFYMQNLDTVYREEICQHSTISIPAGRGKTSFVDVRDVGDVAAKVLSEPGHENKIYTLTGSQALDYFQVAQIMSDKLSRTITYTRPSMREYQNALRAKGVAEEFVKVQGMLYWPIRLGLGGKVTRQVEQLLGRPPFTMRQYVEDYADKWCVVES